ncbi:tyrosine-type recombinase/integrase, partial [Geomonas sp.]|uniref:tyrosine-type recombinase/integrase n=1 Tax=Geomonas sp. TaxID=2651584 RepID=UPI002B4897E1
SGTVFHPANFRKDVWEKAQRASGITDKVPYSLRHTFAAWSLALGIDMNKLVRLMGHGSKKMVYEVYGDYIDGVEEDAWNILEYYGRDFLESKRQRRPNFLGHPGTTTVIPASFLQVVNAAEYHAENPALPLKLS